LRAHLNSSFTFHEKLAEDRFGDSSAKKRRYFAEKKKLRSLLRRLKRLLTVCAEKVAQTVRQELR